MTVRPPGPGPPKCRFQICLRADRWRAKWNRGMAENGRGKTAAGAHFLFASHLPFSAAILPASLPSPLCARARTRSGPLPVRFRCLDLPARAASLVPSLALESLEIEIRFSRQYFAFRTDRRPPAAAVAPQRHADVPISLPPSLLKRQAAPARRPCLLRPTSLPVPNCPYF